MSLTHEVLNQSPPFVDVDLFALDTALTEAVAANGGAGARGELSEFGCHWGSAAMAERGRLANENTPKLPRSILVATAATQSSFTPPITN